MRISFRIGGKGEDIPDPKKLNDDYIISLFLISEIERISVMPDAGALFVFHSISMNYIGL
jgi:hypothetical protein